MLLRMKLIEFARVQSLAFGILFGTVHVFQAEEPTDEELWNELDSAAAGEE